MSRRHLQRGFLLNPYRFGVPTPPPWTPADLATSARHWYAPESTIIDDGSGRCTQIEDLTAGYICYQLTAGSRPTIEYAGLNGYRTLSFDGVNDLLFVDDPDIFMNVSSGWSFLVFKKTALDGAAAIKQLLYFSTGTDGGAYRFAIDISNTTANRLRFTARRTDADTASTLSANTLADTDYHMLLVTMNFSTATVNVYLDGNLPTSGAVSTTGVTSNTQSIVATLGGFNNGSSSSRFTNMKFAEMLLGRGLPTGTETDKLFGYAAHKFGLTSKLPSGHPYKTIAP